MHQKVQTFLEHHTQESSAQSFLQREFSTYRDMETTAFRWTHELSFDRVAEIQDDCNEAIKLWGYKGVMDEDELKNDFNPLFTLTSDLQVMG